MAQLDALQLTDALRRRLVDFVVDDNFVQDRDLENIARSIWAGPATQGGLVSDLWVEGAFPSKASSVTLDDLVNEGGFHPDLRDVLEQASAMPHDRPLYTHQREAIVRAQSGGPGQQPAVVVTAGTGAGKTESFLLPILNDLYRNPSTERRGARCIILYPMNALVNDQVDRLYSWLKGQTQVTLFHFTSETPENKRAADNQSVPEWEPCRMRTRQQARGLEARNGTPIDQTDRGPTPDIIITNYSMLEYMLSRPQDSVFFGPDLRAIVLDEAHLYTGTLAAEITLLLRRVLLRCGLKSEDVLHFATSATLGTGDADELRDFASQVFSKSTKLVHVVAGEQARAPLRAPSPPKSATTAGSINARDWLNGPTIVDKEGGPELIRSRCEELREDLTFLVSEEYLDTLTPGENRPAVLLHESLSATPVVHRLEDVLWNRNHVPLTELAEQVFGEISNDSLQAMVRLLQLTASARLEATAYPLVPHRIHIVARPADCLTVCLNADCSGDARKLPPLGAVAAGYQDTCGFCHSRALTLERCRNCGEWLLAGHDLGSAVVAAPLRVPRNDNAEDSSARRRLFRPVDSSGAVTDETAYIDLSTGERRGSGSVGTVRLEEKTGCPNCLKDKGEVVSFYSGAPIVLSILAETLLAELPELPVDESSTEWLPAQGRRLLVFSDSRREAARLGPMLTNQHEQQLARAAIVNAMQEVNVGDEASLRRAQRQVARLEQELNDPELSSGERIQVERELSDARSRRLELEVGGSLRSWGDAVLKIPFLGQAMDRPSAGEHIASEWSQDFWEANRNAIHRRVEELLGKEFASPIRRTVSTLESLGLVEVTYPGLDKLPPPADLVGQLPTVEIQQTVSQHWSSLLAALCDDLRSSGVVTMGDRLDGDYAFGRMLIGRWVAEDETRDGRGQYGLERFVGATDRQRRRKFAAAVLRSSGMPEDLVNGFSERLLRAVFQQLLDAAQNQSLPWLEAAMRQTRAGNEAHAIRIKFFDLGLRRPVNLFRCRVTRHVWPRSVAGCAPEDGCNGTLEPVSAEILDDDPRSGRRRREYRESPIFQMGLWAEEHSAQLDPRENRRLQDLFKAGIRNVLSSTTTLELGIDIGGLNGVLMSNVPPGKANYLQRAGRAGRRADGSSVVTTFARPRPFDREVFQRIGQYLATPLRRPVVFLDRERVVRRHLHAFLLGEFFGTVYSPDQHTGTMNAYGQMGSFCQVPSTLRRERGNNKPVITDPDNASSLRARFAAFLADAKQDDHGGIVERVHTLLTGTAIASETSAWQELIDSVTSEFDKACVNWQQDYDQLHKLWRETNRQAQANALHYQLRLRRETTVIEALGDRQFLPRYGFPIGVMKLRVMRLDEDSSGRGQPREEDQFRLERQGLLALREYVPGSQLLVGSQLVTSHGVLKHWTGENIDSAIGIRGQYTRCKSGHLHYWTSATTDPDCPFCGQGASRSPTPYLVPQYGFSGATWDPAKWSATTPDIVGEVETVPANLTFAAGQHLLREAIGNIAGLSARYREDGELLVYNEGSQKLGFAICLRCGYSESEEKWGNGAMGLARSFIGHSPLNSRRDQQGRWPFCWSRDTAPVLRNQTLAARETTDVLLMDFSGCLPLAEQNDQALITTLAYALHRAAAELLQLDARELGVGTMPAGEAGGGLGVLLYDNVPGGAGHVRELLERGREWLERAREIMFVDKSHDQRCQSACLDCLLSFQAQNAMLQGHLNRPHALNVLSSLLEGGLPSQPTGTAVQAEHAVQASATQEVARPNNEERLRRVGNNRERRGRSD